MGRFKNVWLSWWRRHWRLVFVVWALIFSVLVAIAIRNQRRESDVNRDLIQRVQTAERHTARALAENKARGAKNRKVIARSDYNLCVKLFSQILLNEKIQNKQTTVPLVKKLFPSLTDQEVRQLVAQAHRRSVKRQERFNPENCQDLPSYRFIKPKGAPNAGKRSAR